MKIRLIHSISALVLSLVLLPRLGLCLPQYRCGDWIQYRPCNDDRSIPALLEQRANEALFLDSSTRGRMKDIRISPSIFSTQYRFDEERQVGVWSGFVHGDGPVVLKLRLNTPGVKPETRYMGRAELRGKMSPFEFRSSPPAIRGWSWQIFAQNAAPES